MKPLVLDLCSDACAGRAPGTEQSRAARRRSRLSSPAGLDRSKQAVPVETEQRDRRADGRRGPLGRLGAHSITWARSVGCFGARDTKRMLVFMASVRAR